MGPAGETLRPLAWTGCSAGSKRFVQAGRLSKRRADRNGTIFLVADRTFGSVRVKLFIVYDLS